MTTVESRKAYEQWHAGFDVDAEADAPWHRLVKAHLRLPTDLGGACLLEIGCGRGGFSCWLARQTVKPREIVAADFSETAVAKGAGYAADHGLSGIRWEVADIQALPFPDCSFDTVVSLETVEHVPDPRGAVAELARVLKPKGRLLLTTPNYLGPLGLYRGYLRLRGRRFTECGQPINHFTLLPRTRSWVRRAGLRIVATDAIGHYVPFPGRPPIRVAWLDYPRFLTKWFAHHSLVVAVK
jgi:2-polyprenyl-3-methyl-5-hydroxy-6-metoxy-1,4-benzoquinol methylase